MCGRGNDNWRRLRRGGSEEWQRVWERRSPDRHVVRGRVFRAGLSAQASAGGTPEGRTDGTAVSRAASNQEIDVPKLRPAALLSPEPGRGAESAASGQVALLPTGPDAALNPAPGADGWPQPAATTSGELGNRLGPLQDARQQTMPMATDPALSSRMELRPAVVVASPASHRAEQNPTGKVHAGLLF